MKYYSFKYSQTFSPANKHTSTHGDLSSPSFEMYPQVTDSYLSLNSLNNFLEAELICFSSAPKRPKAITAPVTAPQVPSENVPPIPPENPFARRANSSVGIPATSQIPIRVACEHAYA